jgi:hypothetical protein
VTMTTTMARKEILGPRWNIKETETERRDKGKGKAPSSLIPVKNRLKGKGKGMGKAKDKASASASPLKFSTVHEEDGEWFLEVDAPVPQWMLIPIRRWSEPSTELS